MKKLAIIILLLLTIFSFWKINENNYEKHREILVNLVEHPESMATKEFAERTSFGYKNLKADIYWLETIQYIGSNAIKSEYKKYLYQVLDLVTELNPYFEHPYKIGLLLLPSHNERYETFSEEELDENVIQAEKIGLKGIKNFCDSEKIEAIRKEDDLRKIWLDDKYKNPCKSYTIPYYLAFVYYFYLNDPAESSAYYKIASANEDSLDGAKILAAIMQGKGGNREKAFFMFLNISKKMDTSEDQTCTQYASELENIGASVFTDKLPLDGKLLKAISDTRDQTLGKFNGDNENQLLSDSDCKNYLNKSIRELNLYYIEKANSVYKINNEGKSAINAKVLLDEGYMDYLPIDYQQYEDYGIVYIYNSEIDTFDYDMGTYE